MIELYGRNVNRVFPEGIQLLKDCGREISPRGELTLEMEEPVSSCYLQPQERVLFYKERDANPFFHFFESLWILAGREDVEFLQYFNKRISQYSDNGKIFHGAYGKRLGFDLAVEPELWKYSQIQNLIEVLKKDRHSRRGVLCLWQPMMDLNIPSKDIPCNDLIFVKIRDDRLNITVCCRSNDIL